MKKHNKLSSCLSSVLQSQQYFCFRFYILSLTLSCLTQKACLMGWELLLLVMTCYFFFLPFITSELTRQLSAAARLSTLDPDVPRVQTECSNSFQNAASDSLRLPTFLSSAPHMPQPFPGGITSSAGWDLAPLPPCPFPFGLRLPAWESAAMLVWLRAELERLLPIWFRAAGGW